MREIDRTAKAYGEGSPGRAFLGAILGMLAALWLCQALYALSGRIFRLPFVAFPLFICCLTLLLRGGGRKLCLVLTIVFSVAGALAVPAGCMAVDYVARYGSLFLNAIPATMVMLPDSRVLSGVSFSSDYVLPAVFIIIGVLIAWELYKYRISGPAQPGEPADADDTDAPGGDE